MTNTVEYKELEGNSTARTQTCNNTVFLQIESPLVKGILHTSFCVMLEKEDAKTVRDMLTKAIENL